jgi:hypothetical protein
MSCLSQVIFEVRCVPTVRFARETLPKLAHFAKPKPTGLYHLAHRGTAGSLQFVLQLTYRVRCRTSIVMSGLFEPPPGREVGELSARPLGFYFFFSGEALLLDALRYTENKAYSQSSILISPLIPRLDLVRRYTYMYIYIYSNACLEMSALVCRVPTL